MKLDKFKGCLLGGAVGDAQGYSVEFSSLEQIQKKYGENGITEYELTDGVAHISDDTQMTLFTAMSLITGKSLWECYREWLCTQFEKFPLDDNLKQTWLSDIPELFSNREAGRTCINTLMHNVPGTIEAPVNNSKGCGGVMRVAPIGLFFDSKDMDIASIDRIGAEAAALTHGHELGWLPAAALVHIIAKIVHEDYAISDAIADMQDVIKTQFGHLEHTSYLMELIDKAIELATANVDDKSAIFELGEGWVAEETLAIAIYCALKYADDFEKAVIASVNHDGDSDSTGSVTGNIVGACLGMDKIPEKFLKDLELKDVIIKISEALGEE